MQVVRGAGGGAKLVVTGAMLGGGVPGTDTRGAAEGVAGIDIRGAAEGVAGTDTRGAADEVGGTDMRGVVDGVLASVVGVVRATLGTVCRTAAG